MTNLSNWLDKLDLGQLTTLFSEHDIDFDVLQDITEDDLLHLGLSLGQRKKLLRGIARLRTEGNDKIDQAKLDAQLSSIPQHSAICEGERRYLTVIFCDLIGSTELSEKLDPEDLRDVMRNYQETCAEIVHRFEGVVARYIGDGILIFFGYPQANENSAVSAVKAGLQIVREVTRLDFDFDAISTGLSVRVGIDSGMVVAGDMMIGETKEMRTIFGKVPNIAARLQAEAEPNTVLISANTFQMVEGHFVCKEPSNKNLKGISQPIATYQIIEECHPSARLEAAGRHSLSPIIGRKPELMLLEDRWRQAKEGEGQIVLLSGEPGIGKSRIIKALQEQIAGESYSCIGYQCSPFHVHTAFYPFIDQMEKAALFDRGDTPEIKYKKLSKLLAKSADDITYVMPAFAGIFSIPLKKQTLQQEITGEKLKQIFTQSIANQLRHLAVQQPLLVVIEDLHWIDPSSLELLNIIAGLVREIRVLIVITFRPEFEPPWIGYPNVTPLTINRLGRKDRVMMVERLTEEKALPVGILEEIVFKTDGVPLFIEEFTRTVQESGLFRDGGLNSQQASPDYRLKIPATLHDSLMARLDHLGSAKEIAQFAAVIGREFSFELLAAAVPVPAEKLQAALHSLVESQLIFESAPLPNSTYWFKHALVQDEAYQSLLNKIRKKHHERIAIVLQDQFPEYTETKPELLAHHFTEAGVNSLAIEYWIKASQLASERSAHEEALAHTHKGLQLAKSLPKGPKRTRTLLSLYLLRGPALITIKGMTSPEVEENYLIAREAGKQLNDTSQLFDVTFGLWIHYEQRGKLEKADNLTNDLFALADSDELCLQAHHATWPTKYSMGDVRKTLEHAKQGIALYNVKKHQSHATRFAGHDPGVCARLHAGIALWTLGYADQARDHAYDALDLADNIAHPFSKVHAHYFTTRVHQFRGEPDLTEKHAMAVIELCDAYGFKQHRTHSLFMCGWACALNGALEQGIQQMQDAFAQWELTGDSLRRAYYLILLAETFGMADRIDDGLDAVDEALNSITEIGERRWEAEANRIKGELLHSKSSANDVVATEMLDRATRIAQQQHAKSFELRAAMSLGRIWNKNDRRADAHDLVLQVYNFFTEGFETADLRAAKAMLNELSSVSEEVYGATNTESP